MVWKLNNKYTKYIKNYINIIVLLIIVLLILYIINRVRDNFENTKGINKVDGVVYINLENRPDRKKIIEEEMKKMGIDIYKINKVAGIYIPKNGHKGCVQSHILALNISKMNNWDNVLILEDDAELNVTPEVFNNKINEMFDYLEDKDWDVIMIGKCNTLEKENYNDILKLKSATCGTGYIVNNHYYNKLLDLFIDCNSKMTPDKWGESGNWEPNALDQRWNKLQKEDNWYGFKKDLLKQRNSWSTTNAKGSKD